MREGEEKVETGQDTFSSSAVLPDTSSKGRWPTRVESSFQRRRTLYQRGSMMGELEEMVRMTSLARLAWATRPPRPFPSLGRPCKVAPS